MHWRKLVTICTYHSLYKKALIILVGIKLIPACHFLYIFGIVFAMETKIREDNFWDWYWFCGRQMWIEKVIQIIQINERNFFNVCCFGKIIWCTNIFIIVTKYHIQNIFDPRQTWQLCFNMFNMNAKRLFLLEYCSGGSNFYPSLLDALLPLIYLLKWKISFALAT